MKILFISDVYFPRINGVSTSIETFRHNLRSLGHTVHLIAPDYFSLSADETDILRVPARQVPFDPEDMVNLTNCAASNTTSSTYRHLLWRTTWVSSCRAC